MNVVWKATGNMNSMDFPILSFEREVRICVTQHFCHSFTIGIQNSKYLNDVFEGMKTMNYGYFCAVETKFRSPKLVTTSVSSVPIKR